MICMPAMSRAEPDDLYARYELSRVKPDLIFG